LLDAVIKVGNPGTLAMVLSDKRIDPRRYNRFGDNILLKVCEREHPIALKELLDDGRIDPLEELEVHLLSVTDDQMIPQRGVLPMEIAIETDDLAKLKILLADSRITQQVVEDRHLLHQACEFASEEIVKLLLNDVRVDPNAIGPCGTAIETAVDDEILMILLASPKVDVNVHSGNRNHSFFSICEHSAPTVVQQFLKRGVKSTIVDKNGRTALHYACSGNNTETMLSLLSEGKIDPNLPDPVHFNRTILHMSVLRKAGDVIESLLRDSRVDVNAKDQFGRTALHIARWKQSKEIEEILLRSPAIETSSIPSKEIAAVVHSSAFDIKASIENELVAYYLLREGDYEILQHVIEDPRFDINFHDIDNPPLLITAIEAQADAEIVRFMLAQKSIDVNIRHETETPLKSVCIQIEMNRECEETLLLLLDHKDIVIDDEVKQELSQMSIEDAVKISFLICTRLVISPQDLFRGFLYEPDDVYDSGDEEEEEEDPTKEIINQVEQRIRIHRSKSARKAPPAPKRPKQC